MVFTVYNKQFTYSLVPWSVLLVLFVEFVPPFCFLRLRHSAEKRKATSLILGLYFARFVILSHGDWRQRKSISKNIRAGREDSSRSKRVKGTNGSKRKLYSQKKSDQRFRTILKHEIELSFFFFTFEKKAY